MAKKAISDLDPAAAITGSELIEGEQSGGSVQMTAANVARSLYKRYVALLSQTGTDAPLATVLENTLGGTVVWTRNEVGDYTGTLSGVFTANKTWFPSPNFGWTSALKYANISRSDNNSIQLYTTEEDGTTQSDEWTDLCIEIRVYP